MDIVLGVSMTPMMVRMVLVEGENADGATVDHDVFDIDRADGAATLSASDQVVAAILGTHESAEAGGHRLLATGVAWSDHDEAAELRKSLTARGIEGVALVSQLHAAGALAQAAGRAVGYDRTALLFIEGDTATLSVVETTDGSIVKVDSESLHSDDAMAVLAETLNGLEEESSRPDGIFLLGSGVDVASVKQQLEDHVTIPVNAPKDPEVALARGAALAAVTVPEFDASTVGLAYSLDPEGTTAGKAYPMEDPATDATDLVTVGGDGSSLDDVAVGLAPQGRKAVPLVGSSLMGIFVVGVVALVISLAVSIRPTVDTRPNPGDNVVGPSSVAPPPEALPAQPPVQQLAPPPPAMPPPPPAVQTIQEPVPVVQQQPAPRAVVAQAAPAPKAAPAAPPPAAPPAPAPEAAPPAPPPAAEPAALPPDNYPPTNFPPGAFPPGAFPPGAYPPGAYPPGAYPPGAYPPGAYGPGAYPPGGYPPSYGGPPAGPVVPIVPGLIGLGPGPSYRSPAREYAPPWGGPPEWPSGPGRYRGGWGNRAPWWPGD
jgi:hypothetical protein